MSVEKFARDLVLLYGMNKTSNSSGEKDQQLIMSLIEHIEKIYEFLQNQQERIDSLEESMLSCVKVMESDNERHDNIDNIIHALTELHNINAESIQDVNQRITKIEDIMS